MLPIFAKRNVLNLVLHPEIDAVEIIAFVGFH